VARPSLDDVYLRHTGRRYSESETENDHSERELVEASKLWLPRNCSPYRTA
jgi:hypothetical protein